MDRTDHVVLWASDRGWSPGYFQKELEYDGKHYVYERTETRDGDVIAWHFVNANRDEDDTLVVYND